MYLDKPEQWKAVVRVLEQKKFCGLDSEFFGVNFDEGQSCYGRARIHVWSIGILGEDIGPRGNRKAKGCVLPVNAIPYFQGVLEDPGIVKVPHNANVDVHAFGNGRADIGIPGVDVQGVVDSLSLAKWLYSDRFTHSLDALGQELLGYGKITSWKELVTEDYTYIEEKSVQKKRCSCGTPGCRLRSVKYNSAEDVFVDHTIKVEVTETQQIEKTGSREIPLYEIVPGHPRFALLCEYAKTDAVIAAELFDLFMQNEQEVDIPWYQTKSII